MHLRTTTGNSSGPPRVERGASVVHERRHPSLAAVRAADILDGFATYQPTARELARAFRVSVVSIAKAQRLTPAQRQRVRAGASLHSISATSQNGNGAHHLLDLADIDQTTLDRIASIVGSERMFNAAVDALK
jgi:hypothetical protein